MGTPVEIGTKKQVTYAKRTGPMHRCPVCRSLMKNGDPALTWTTVTENVSGMNAKRYRASRTYFMHLSCQATKD